MSTVAGALAKIQSYIFFLNVAALFSWPKKVKSKHVLLLVVLAIIIVIILMLSDLA